MASVLVISLVALSAIGCGGTTGKESSGSKAIVEISDTEKGTTDYESTESETGETGITKLPGQGASFVDALFCLQGEGIDALDQSAINTDEVIEIEYGDESTTITFEKEEAAADKDASAAEGENQVIQVGAVVAVIAPSADSDDTDTVESCITG